MNILEIDVKFDEGIYYLSINLPDEAAAKYSAIAKLIMSLAFTLLKLKVEIDIE